MSFLEDMACKEVSGMLANSSMTRWPPSVMQMVNNQPGGISRTSPAVSRQRSGKPGDFLGRHGSESSYFGYEQLQNVLGSEQVKDFAAKAGISPEAASSHLAQLLPMLIDKLTPNGQASQSSSMLEQCMGMLKNVGLGKTGN